MATSSWNLAPPPGFQGLREDLSLKVYHRHLPHWRQDGATYFVTFRLADALPQSHLAELRLVREEWERRHPHPRSQVDWEPLVRELTRREEDWLDQGLGSCLLRHDDAAGRVVEAMHYFDDRRYELDCHVVMPNHVHLILRPLAPDRHPLETILQSWKTYTPRTINKRLKREGHLWQEESFDRIIRDEEHLWRSVQYIGRNPSKAGLQAAQSTLWLRPAWQELGRRFDVPV